MPSAFAFSHRIEVRFRDCDPMGHVNHAVYLTYLEQCRFAYWRHLTGAQAGPAARIIIARAECDYRAPAFFGEQLEVRVSVGDIGRSSFTLTYEIVNAMTEAGFGQTTCIGIGGDPIIGTSMVDALAMFQKDRKTKRIVVVGEIGGTAEEEAADFIERRVTKPVVAYVAGRTAPPGKRMGHAGAIIQGNRGTAESKVKAFEAAGVPVAEYPVGIPRLLAAT